MVLNTLALTGVCKASVCYLDQVDTRQVVVKVLLIGKTTLSFHTSFSGFNHPLGFNGH